VRFNENDRIEVIDGPLAGMEGRIVRVDRRKGRARVKLDLYDDSFAIDLGIELVTPAGAAARP
jgi:transcriptional antiterminator NusG